MARGHDVTLFASGDSLTVGPPVLVVPHGWSEDATLDPKVAECLHIAQVFEQADEFDIIHNGFDFLPLTYSGLVPTPVVTTIHGFSSEKILPVYVSYNARSTYVAISDADRHPALEYMATIHHGIDTGACTFSPSTGTYLAFFGRIHPDKGVVAAIDTAAAAGIPLKLAGIIQDQRYFDTEVAPRAGRRARAEFVGPVLAEDRSAFLGGALALLHLIDFDEPFGFSVVEAMACGTPVIAFDRGSMPELIDDGTTGYLVARRGRRRRRRVPGRGVGSSPGPVRGGARFGHDRMVDAYVDVYRQVIGQSSERT